MAGSVATAGRPPGQQVRVEAGMRAHDGGIVQEARRVHGRSGEPVPDRLVRVEGTQRLGECADVTGGDAESVDLVFDPLRGPALVGAEHECG